jgi:predicted ATPase/DNA-binding CsgD family transcriptional regulator
LTVLFFYDIVETYKVQTGTDMQVVQESNAQAEAGHLPVQPTPFVGRRQELDSLAALLAAPDCRLVTLVGPGGIGKTRLSLQVATGLHEVYPDGIFLVDLAGISDPALVAQTVMSALGLRDDAQRSSLETLSAALRDKRLLLTLDNCEHLLDACAELARGLLTSCPQLSILATSREPLHTAGEIIWEVPPLSLPALEQLPPPDDLLSADAVTLFVDRARRVLPTFTLGSQNAPLVARLCHRLDGLPLAIELAAARIRVLSVAQIYERLDDALRLLVGGDRLAPSRQQTLRATLDWSYDLLTTHEQSLLQRLSVFAGTFDLAAAEEICSGDGLERPGILDILSGLVDKSLVVAEHGEGKNRRYRLLDTIGWYASERLATSGATGKWRDRHLDWYLHFAEQADPKHWGIGDVGTLERLELERGNLWAAMRWAIEAGQAEKGHRLTVAMGWYWFRGAHLHEGRHWFDQILALPGKVAPQTRVGALETAGSLTVALGDYQQAVTFLQECVTLGRAHERSIYLAYGLQQLAILAFHKGDHKRGDELLAESLEAFDESFYKAGAAFGIVIQGWQAHYRGDQERAEALFQASLPDMREIGDAVGTGHALRGLAAVARQRGDLDAAAAHLQEELRLASYEGDRMGLAQSLAHLAGIARAQARPERAARLLGAAEALHQATGFQPMSWDRSSFEQDIRDARASLGDTAFEAAFAAGQAVTQAEAVEFALQDGDDGRRGTGAEARTLTPLQAAKQKYGGLTAREREVAILIAQGKSNPAIADELVVTLRTVEAHVTHILRKLGFDSRAQVAGWAVDIGLASAPKTALEQMREPHDAQQPQGNCRSTPPSGEPG